MPLSTDTGMVLTGDKELIRNLERLPIRVQRKVVRQAVSAALTPLNKEMKRQAPKDTGTLKKSIGKKIKTYKNDGVVWGAVGVRSGFATTIDGKHVNPRLYVHLVENLTGFMRRAFDLTRRQVLSILGKKLGSGIEREAKKL